MESERTDLIPISTVLRRLRHDFAFRCTGRPEPVSVKANNAPRRQGPLGRRSAGRPEVPCETSNCTASSWAWRTVRCHWLPTIRAPCHQARNAPAAIGARCQFWIVGKLAYLYRHHGMLPLFLSRQAAVRRCDGGRPQCQQFSSPAGVRPWQCGHCMKPGVPLSGGGTGGSRPSIFPAITHSAIPSQTRSSPNSPP